MCTSKYSQLWTSRTREARPKNYTFCVTFSWNNYCALCKNINKPIKLYQFKKIKVKKWIDRSSHYNRQFLYNCSISPRFLQKMDFNCRWAYSIGIGNFEWLHILSCSVLLLIKEKKHELSSYTLFSKSSLCQCVSFWFAFMPHFVQVISYFGMVWKQTNTRKPDSIYLNIFEANIYYGLQTSQKETYGVEKLRNRKNH